MISCDLLLVRRLTPVHPNVGKRLVKSPKVYVRDSGLLHELLGISDYNALAGHPSEAPAGEGFVVEILIGVSAGAPYRAFIEPLPAQKSIWFWSGPVAELSRSKSNPALFRPIGKGFHIAVADIKPAASFVVYAGEDRYSLGAGVEAIGLRELMALIEADKV